MTDKGLKEAMGWSNPPIQEEEKQVEPIVEAVVETPIFEEKVIEEKVEAPIAEKQEGENKEEEKELSFLEKLKLEAVKEPEKVIEPVKPEAKVEPVKELTENEKLAQKFFESGLTLEQLAKSIVITDYSKMSNEDLIRINLERQFGADKVTEDLLESELAGFENLIPSQKASYLNSIKNTLGEEVKYGEEVAKYLDETISAKNANQPKVVSQTEIEAQRTAIIEAETKADLEEINTVINRLGIPQELATELIGEYSYEKAVAYVKDGKLDAVTFLDHAYKIKHFENAEKRGYEKGYKEAKEKFTNAQEPKVTNNALNTKPIKQQIEEQLKYNN